MSPRPLVRRRPDGTRYIAPSELPTTRPRYSSGLPAQLGSGDVSEPEPTPKAAPSSTRPRVADETVLELRAEFATGKWNPTELAYIFDLPYFRVRGIVLGHTYKNVKAPQAEED